MAKIPLGNFGNSVARPQQAVRVPALTAGFQAAGQVADTAMRIVSDIQQREQRAQDEAREMADRAQTIATMARTKDSLQQQRESLVQGVLTGTVDKRDAVEQWQKASDQTLRDAEVGIPAAVAPIVRAQLQAQALEMSGGVRQAVERRDIDDTRAGLFSYLEVAERDAIGNRASAVLRASEAIEGLGPFAGLGADDRQRLTQSFREKAAFNAGGALVRGARDDMQSLDGVLARLKSDEFADLSADRLGQLEQQVLGRKAFLANQEMTRIARAEAQAAKREREAESAFKATQSLIDSGAIPAPDYLAGVTARTAGTPYGAALTVLMQQASERAGFAQLSPPQQQQTILALRAKANAQGSTPDLEKRIDLFERQHAAGQKQLAEDGLLYGVNRRLIDEVAPLDFTSITDIVPQMQRRIEQARTVSARVGQPVSPLMKDEAERVAGMLALLPITERARAVRQLAKVADPAQAQALAAQIGGKDSVLGLAMFAAIATEGAPRNVPELILRGADAEKAGRLKGPAAEGANADRARIAQELARVPWSTTRARDAAVQATQAIYDGLRDERGGRANVDEAIRLGTGGLTEWNGDKVPLPPGMEERQFRRRLNTLDPQQVERQAGGAEVMVGGQVVPISTLVQNMGAVRLIPAGPGVYALQSGGAMVMTGKGAVLRLSLGE